MKVTWTARGRHDLRGIVQYIMMDSPAAARSVRERIDAAAARLDTMPHRDRPGRMSGTREIIVRTLPYLIVYRVLDTEVEILRVLHQARDWPPRDGD